MKVQSDDGSIPSRAIKQIFLPSLPFAPLFSLLYTFIPSFPPCSMSWLSLFAHVLTILMCLKVKKVE